MNIENDGEEIPISQLLEQNTPNIVAVKTHIYLYDEINKETARSLFTVIHELAMGLIENSIENNTNIPPIWLHINSYGGNVNDALAIVQGIRDIQTGRIHQVGNVPIKLEVNTIIEGEADSSASLIACVGTKRYMSKYALSLLHDVRQISGGGKAEEIDIQAKNLSMFKKKFYDIYLSHSKLKEEELAKICSQEDYSTPEQLLEWGLIDEILEE